MKKKFWITFLISMVVFSTIFVKASPYIFDKEKRIGSNNAVELNEDDIDANQGEVLFLLMGIDDDQITGGIDKVKEKVENSDTRYVTTGMRSDTMMLCRVNFDTGETQILSIPRDTKTAIRTRKNEEKINHAHSYGGPNLAVDTVRDLLGVDLNYYVTVDYRAVEELVDSIGGVDLYVPRDMHYSDPTSKPPLYIDLKEGQQVLDGDKSIQFLRWRKDNNGGGYAEGDGGRVKAQQYFMKEFAKQLISPKNIVQLPKMVKTYFDYVDTNIPMGIVMKGIGVATKIDIDGLEQLTLPGEGQYIGKTAYFLHDEEKTREMVDEKLREFKIER